MTRADEKTIRKWAKLQAHWDTKGIIQSAIKLYASQTPTENERMMLEFTNFINGVRSGIIKPQPIKINIPRIKISDQKKLN